MNNFKVGDVVIWEGERYIIEYLNKEMCDLKSSGVLIKRVPLSELTLVHSVHTSLSPLGIEPREMSFERQKEHKRIYGDSLIGREAIAFIEWLKLQINQPKAKDIAIDDLVEENYRLKEENSQLRESTAKDSTIRYQIFKIRKVLEEF